MGQCYHQKVFKIITWLPLTRLQGNKPHRNSPEPSGTCLPELACTSTHRNSPEPSGTCLRNLHQAHTGTPQNLPERASGTYTSTHQNSLEPSGTFRRNLDQHTHWNSPEPSGTCLYTSTHTGTLWNLPELASGTYTKHTPELSGTFRNLPPEPTPAHTRTL